MGVKAILFGEFTERGKRDDIRELIERLASIKKVPVVVDLPFGHGLRNITLPIGINAVLDTSEGIIFTESCLNIS